MQKTPFSSEPQNRSRESYCYSVQIDRRQFQKEINNFLIFNSLSIHLFGMKLDK